MEKTKWLWKESQISCEKYGDTLNYKKLHKSLNQHNHETYRLHPLWHLTLHGVRFR